MRIEGTTVLGRYEIRSKIGAGGMGEVYLAQDLKLDRKVALKILPAEVAANRDRMMRFVQEAKTASGLNHPNIITIHEIDQVDSVHFIASEFIDGDTLRGRIRQQPLKVSEVLEIGMQIAGALSAAHAAGIVHRDIKPENIMLRNDGIVKVVDFGLAKLTESPQLGLDPEAPTRAAINTEPGVVMGTAIYMSPEQARGLEVDTRTDIFSLGVLIYELVAGRAPFDGLNSNEIMASIISDREPQPMSRYSSAVPAELERIVTKALRKNRDDRYQTSKDLLLDLKSLKQRLEFESELERSSPVAERVTDVLSAPATVRKSAETASLKPRRRSLVFALFALIVALIAVAGYVYFSRKNGTAIQSIAVLPFENASGNAELDYLSEGVSESVIDRLSQLPQLKVIARTSSFQYRGQNLDLKKIADVLAVQAIVTGRVVQRGDGYGIRVDVTDVRENKQLWGENFTRKASDLQALQSDISREIAENLRLRLTGAQQQQFVKQQTTNPQAYELVLKGVFFRNKGSEEDVKRSIECFQQAISIDPNYARAYAGLADSYRTAGRDAREMLHKREAAVLKALELDDNLAEAHVSMGQYRRDLWQWQEAEREFKRAMELNPNSPHPHSGYSGLLSLLGRHEEAMLEDKRAKELDPVGVIANTVVGRTLHYAGRYDEAIEQLKKTIELDRNATFPHLRLGAVYETKGLYQEATVEYQRAIELGHVGYEAQIRLAAAYARMGERERALNLIKQVQTRNEYVAPVHLAIFYLAVGESEQALVALEKGYADRSPSLQFLRVDPAFDSLRSNSRFQDLLRRMGLSQ